MTKVYVLILTEETGIEDSTFDKVFGCYSSYEAACRVSKKSPDANWRIEEHDVRSH